jgi:adenine deaminase
VITGVRVRSTYSERMADGERELWIAGGRIAAVKPAGTYQGVGAIAMTATAVSSRRAWSTRISHRILHGHRLRLCRGGLLNGTTTIFCDSHEIGNVMDVAGVEAMLEDARQAPLSIFLTVPSHGALPPRRSWKRPAAI